MANTVYKKFTFSSTPDQRMSHSANINRVAVEGSFIPTRFPNVTLTEDTLQYLGEGVLPVAGQECERKRNLAQLVALAEFTDTYPDFEIKPIIDDDTGKAIARMFDSHENNITPKEIASLFDDLGDPAAIETIKRLFGSFEDDTTTKKLQQILAPIKNKPKDLKRLFNSPLTWSYRCYQIDAPGSKSQHIYLFNVLIAYEWIPTTRDLQIITETARNASNFLYDVTDGWMAFGQVVIGGPAFMDCADIQIMASNRLLPRSWVGALHEMKKYMPLRLGRGMWQKNNRVSIPWNEPEGYRVLIHEWAHYALELLDAYLQIDSIYDRNGAEQASKQAQRAEQQVVVPKINLPVESIMDSLEGTSELVPKQNLERKSTEWDRIIAQKRFPRIIDVPESIEGPLPIKELPHVAQIVVSDVASQAPNAELLLFDIPPYIDLEHCWVYILQYRSDQSGAESKSKPSYLIAQGTLDVRARIGFQLLGAQQGDDIVLIGNPSDGKRDARVLVQRGKIINTQAITEADPRNRKVQYANNSYEAIIKWEPIARGNTDLNIDVLPASLEHYNSPTAPLIVRVSGTDTNKAEVTIFPLGKQASVSLNNEGSTTTPVPLDGHILISFDDASNLAIAAYSQGGGPPTGSPVGATPITAGSSEGNLMIFFADRGDYPQTHLGRTRIVTTRLPYGEAKLTSGAEARSYGFSLGSNEPLPLDYLPTLVLAYDKQTELDHGTPFIHRQTDTGWIPVQSYRPRGAWYVATPLNAETAPRLFRPDLDQEDRVERYRLYLVPRVATSIPSDTANMTETTAKGHADLNGA